MAELGFATVNEMVGQSRCLEFGEVSTHPKARFVDFSSSSTSPIAARRHALQPRRNRIMASIQCWIGNLIESASPRLGYGCKRQP